MKASLLSIVLAAALVGQTCSAFKIYVKDMSGSITIIDAESKTTIAELKERIGAKSKMPVDRQQLVFHGTVLEDQTRVEDYGIDSNSVVHLVARPEVLVNQTGTMRRLLIKNMAGSTITVDVEKSSTIAEVKRKVAEKDRIAADNVKLIFAGKHLEDGKTVAEYKLESGSLLHMLPADQLQQTHPVTIKTESGSAFEVKVGPETKIIEIKKQVSERNGVDVDRVRLILDDQLLANKEIAAVCGIKESSTLHIVLIPESKTQVAHQLFVKNLSGTIIAIDVDDKTTIAEVKQKLADKNGLAVDQMRLIYKDRLLRNHKTVLDYKLADASNLELVSQPTVEERPSKFSLLVHAKDQTGKLYGFRVEPETTIGEVKLLLCQKDGIGPQRQRFYLDGVQLEDQKSIADYDIEHNTVIHLSAVSEILSNQAPAAHQLFVKDMTGTRIAVDVERKTTIAEVKRKIAAQSGLVAEQIKLVFASKQLDDERTVADYGMENASMLHMVVRPSAAV